MKYTLFTMLAGTVFAASLLSAQEAQHGPDNNMRITIPGIEVLAVTGKPFTGKDRIEWTRHLENGSAVKVHLDANVIRDSQGRLYRERRSFTPDPNAESQLTEKIYYDPSAKTKTTCTINTHECLITAYRMKAKVEDRPAGSFANGTRFLAREALGTNTLDGLEVVGTRETLTINAGVVGNEQALVTTKEYWYSPELGTNLKVVRNDPRDGTQAIRLTVLSRSEPDAAQFEIPVGFTVKDIRPSAAGGSPAAESPQSR